MPTSFWGFESRWAAGRAMEASTGRKERRINQIKVGFSKETINRRRRRSRGKLKLRMKINFNSFSLCLIENNASESFFCWLPSAGVQSSRNTRKADETSWKLNWNLHRRFFLGISPVKTEGRRGRKIWKTKKVILVKHASTEISPKWVLLSTSISTSKLIKVNNTEVQNLRQSANSISSVKALRCRRASCCGKNVIKSSQWKVSKII